MQRAHALMIKKFKIGQNRHKTYYGYRAYGPMYSDREQKVAFFPTVKKWETISLISLYKRSCTNVVMLIELTFCVPHKKNKACYKICIWKQRKNTKHASKFSCERNLSAAMNKRRRFY